MLLKFEATKNSLGLNLRQKNSFFTLAFLKALFIALAIHFGAATIFQIQRFFRSGERILSPTTVEQTQFDHFTNEVVMDPESERHALKLAFEYKASEPRLPKVTLEQKTEQTEKKLQILESCFLEDLFFKEKKSNTIQPSVLAKGNLAQHNLICDGLAQKEPINTESVRIICEVLVEMKEGTIFWFQHNASPNLRKRVESILHEIRFQQADEFNIVKGEIEVILPLIEALK